MGEGQGVRGSRRVPRLCQPCCYAVDAVRTADTAVAQHPVAAYPEGPIPWPCSTSNRCPAGPERRTSSRCWTPPAWTAATWAASSCTASRPSSRSPTAAEARLVKALDGRQFGDRRVRAWTSSPTTASPGVAGPSDEDDFLRLARLLDLESRAEAQKAADEARRLSPEEAQQTGNTLLNLMVVDEEAGLGGRYLVHLGRRGRGPLPWTRLGVGSPVVLSPQAAKAAQPHRGVVCDRDERVHLRGPGSPARGPGRPRRVAAGPVVRRGGRGSGSGQPWSKPGLPAATASPSSATCSWAGGSRSSASIPRCGRWTPASTRSSARRCSSPSPPATWA